MPRISTRLADMVLTMNGRLIEVHYHEGVQLDVSGLMEVQLRRDELTEDRCAMLAFFPQGILGDLKVMQVDYFGRTNAGEQLIALAIVNQDDLGSSMSGIYYSYNPQPFPIQLFREEAAARAWITDRLEEELGSDR